MGTLYKFYFFIALIISLLGCNNPIDETEPTDLLNGTWMYKNSYYDSIKISFDSNLMRFIDQIGYEYGSRREFYGSFIMTDSTIRLEYDYGRTANYKFEFEQNYLTLSTELFQLQLERISQKSNLNGWSTKLIVSEEYTIDFTYDDIYHLANSEDRVIALVQRDYSINDIDLVTISSDGYVFKEDAPNIYAIDSHGGYLWIVNDLKVIKRTLNDSSVISSFNYRYSSESDSLALGIVVSADYLYLLLKGEGYGNVSLIKYSLDGIKISTIKTSSVFKDMCLIGNRLFCTTGSETFVELNPTTGMVINNYNVQNRPFGNNIEGITYSGTELLIAIHGSEGRKISSLIIQ